MAKGPIISDVADTPQNAAAINTNLHNLSDSFDNTISRDGSTPNQMEADIDLNSNDLLNIKDVNAANLIIAGTNLNDKVDEAATSATNAATSEANASTSEANASSSAAASLVSENNAATSETNAANSAASIDVDKLAGIEENADVTDTANVTSSGALMDSELTSITSVKALDQGVATTDSPEFASVFLGGSAAANELNDYEEGTWTPVLGDGTSPDATYSIQVGSYIKVGNKVHIQGQILISSLGTISGDLILTGLPFVSTAPSNDMTPVPIGFAAGLNISAGHVATGYIENNASKITFTIWDSAAGTTNLSSSEFSSNGRIIFSAEYIAS